MAKKAETEVAEVQEVADAAPAEASGDAADTHLANPYVPGDEAKPAVPTEPVTVKGIIKLWGGGEHRRAMTASYALSDEDRAEVAANCPGWAELAQQG